MRLLAVAAGRDVAIWNEANMTWTDVCTLTRCSATMMAVRDSLVFIGSPSGPGGDGSAPLPSLGRPAPSASGAPPPAPSASGARGADNGRLHLPSRATPGRGSDSSD